MFFMGGRPKPGVLKEFQPHIFFDDQDQHVAGAAAHVPSARVLGTVTDTPKVPETSLTVSLTANPVPITATEAEVECTKKDFEDRARVIFSRYTPLGKRRGHVDAKYRKFITDHSNRLPVERAKIIRGLEKYDLSSLTTHDPMLNREDDDDVAKKLEKVVTSAIGPKQTELGL
jgi:hypothetical protein